MTTFSPLAAVKRTVCGYNEADKEEVDDVEDADTPDNLSCCFGDLFSWVFCLSGCQASKFGSAKGE